MNDNRYLPINKNAYPAGTKIIQAYPELNIELLYDANMTLTGVYDRETKRVFQSNAAPGERRGINYNTIFP